MKVTSAASVKALFAFLFVLLSQYGFSQTTSRFNDGYINVLRVTSSAALNGNGTAVVVDEFKPTGTGQSPNYTAIIPSGTGAGYTIGATDLVVAGSSTNQGAITRFQNGRFLAIPGYKAKVADASTTFNTNGAIRTVNGNGTVGVGVDAGGVQWLSGNNGLRGATSDDGTNYWLIGSTTGVQTTTTGAVTLVSSTPANNRGIFIFNGQLYLTTASAPVGIYSVGSGKPTNTGNTATRLFAPTSTDANAFSISPDGNTIYYAAGTGVYRSTYNGTIWTAGTLIFSGAYLGLAVNWNGYTFSAAGANGAVIFACTTANLVMSNDNGTSTATTSILATAAANNAFRQLAFSPVKQTVILGASSPATGNITTNSTDVSLFQFNFNADEGNALMQKVVVHNAGTAVAGTDITNLRLIDDANGNGVYDVGETILSTGSASGSDVTFSIASNSQAYVNQGGSKNYLVIGNVASGSGSTFIPSIVSNQTLNSTSYTTNLVNGSGSWVNIGATAPNGNTLSINAGAGNSTTTLSLGAASPATISSLVNTQGAASTNFNLTVTDAGGDAVATKISALTFNAGTGNTVIDWSAVIAGAELSDGTTSTTSATIGTSSILFSGLPTTVGTLGYVGDGTAKTYTLKVWLKSALSSALQTSIDGQILVFRIQTSDVSTVSGGSAIQASQDVNSGATSNKIDVAASALSYVQQPTTTNTNVAMSPSVTVAAIDANGNRDLDFVSQVRITSTGTLSGSPVDVAAVSGLATFSSLIHTTGGTGLTLTAQRTATSDWNIISSSFNAVAPSSTTRFNDGSLSVFRSTAASSGNNASVVIDEFYPTGSNQTANFSVSLPSSASVLGTKDLVITGSGIATGGITRSYNGRYLSIPGYKALSGSTPNTANGAVRTISGSGIVGTGIDAGATTWFSAASGVRGATTDDGTNYWISGSGGGLLSTTNGSTITIVSSTSTNNRDVFLYNSQLYYTTGAGTTGIYKVGSGMPITSGITPTLLFTPTSGDVYAFSLSPDGNTLYYVTATSNTGVYRSTFNGSTWTGGTLIYTGTGFTGLAVNWTNYSFSTSSTNGAVIFASNPTTLITASDNGINALSTTTLATADGVNNAFRQIAFSPIKQTVSKGSNTPASGNISTYGQDVPLFQFALAATEGNSTMQRVVVHCGGSATIGSDITSFRLIDDANGNGVFDNGETVLSTGTISGSDITFSSIALSTMLENSSRSFLMIGNVNSGTGNTFIPSIVANQTLNSVSYTTNLVNGSGSWVSIGTTAPTGNLLSIIAGTPPPGATTLSLGAASPATISSLINTQGAASANFTFTVSDDAANASIDALPTQISQIVFNAGTGNTVTNWNSVIAGVELSDDNGNTTTSASIGSNSITFSSLSYFPGAMGYVADDASKTYTLKVWLKSSLSNALQTSIDGQHLVFRVQTSSITTVPSTSSNFQASEDVNSGATSNTVDVGATSLVFVQQPTNSNYNVSMSPAVTVSAIDANGNRDLDFVSQVRITSTGTLAGSPVDVAAVSGLATFSTLTHTAAGTGLTLTAKRTATLDWNITSNSFTIIVPPSLTEVYLPKYMQGISGTNTNRVPFVYRVTLGHLTPNATYRYFNTAVLSSDGATSTGAGNVIFPLATGYIRTTSASLATAGAYNTFTTDANGSYTGWFVTEPTGNARFAGGNQVYMRIVLNDGNNGTTPATYLTTTNTVSVINFASGANGGTPIRGTSSATAKNLVLLWDNTAGTGRPVSGTFVESDGTPATSYAAFYSSVDGVAGSWGTIIPNSNVGLPNGIRRIEQYDLATGSAQGCAATSGTGVWPTNTVDTRNTTGGTTALVISSSDAPLIIPSAPTISAGGPTTFCSSSSVTLTSSSSVNNVWLKNGVAINAANGTTYVATTSGNYSAMVNYNGCASSASATISLTATPAPSATIAYNGSPYCSTGGTATVTRTGTTGGSYSSTSGLVLNTANGNIDLATSTAGTYTVTYTVAASGGCADYTTTTDVTITTAPSASISYVNSPYCANGGTATVTQSGTTGGTYSSSAGLTIDANTGTITLGTSTPGTYTVTYTVAAAGGCSVYTTTASVTIISNLNISISYAGNPFCQTGNGIVTRTGLAGGTYSGDAGILVNPTSGVIFPSASTPGIHTITYTVTSLGGCTNSATTQVTILPTPTITLGTAAPICFSAAAQTASLPYSATTNSPSTFTIRANASGPMPGFTPVVNAPLTGSPITVNIPAGTLGGTYYFDLFVGTANGCSSGKYGFQVFVVSQASTTITYNGSPFCRTGSSYGLVTRTGAAGGTYSSTPGLTVDATTGTIFPGTSTPGTYTVTYTINNSGCTFSTTTSVTVLATPTVNLSPVPSICFSPGAQTANLPYSGTSGSPVTYSLTAGPNSPMPGFVSVVNAALPASPITINIPASTPGGLYYFTFSSKNAQGCVSGNYTVGVTIVGTNTTIAYNGGQPICQTGSAIVTRSGAAGGTYSSTAGLLIDANSGTIFPASSTAGPYTVTYTVVSASGCTFSTTTNVTIQALPKIAPITVAPVCQSAGATTASLPYTVTAGSPATYTLTVSTSNPMPNFVAVTDVALTASPLTVNIPAGTAAGTYYFFITLKSAAGCTSAKYTFGITVKPMPTASISYANSPYSTATGGATVTFSGTTGGTFSSTPGLNLNATTGSIYPATSTPGNYTVSYTVTTATGCTVTTTTPVTITPATTPRVVSTTPKSVTKTAPVVAVEEKITIAPNPVEHRVTVRVSNISDPMQIRITDATGKEILKGTKFTASYAFDMSGYAQGIYMVEVVNEKTGTVSRQKLMKK